MGPHIFHLARGIPEPSLALYRSAQYLGGKEKTRGGGKVPDHARRMRVAGRRECRLQAR